MATEKRVKAADRTLDLFEAFSRAGRPLNLSELAKAVDIPVSSCHGLVRTLTSRGYLSEVGTQRMHYPTRRLFDLAQGILARDPILMKVSPILAELREKTGETIVFAKRLDKFVIYLDVMESHKTIRFSAVVSALRPLHSSALGKALIGAMPLPRRTEFVDSLDLTRVTANTIANAKKLLSNLAEAEARGWHSTRGESVDDVMAIARSVMLGGETYAVAVAGPLARMEPLEAKHVKSLATAVAQMQAQAG
ncbi:IclR family transcriptional regulator [soil metagenome]